MEKLLGKWDSLRDSYMNIAEAESAKRAEFSRIAAAYEFCSDGLRVALGRTPRWT